MMMNPALMALMGQSMGGPMGAKPWWRPAWGNPPGGWGAPGGHPGMVPFFNQGWHPPGGRPQGQVYQAQTPVRQSLSPAMLSGMGPMMQGAAGMFGMRGGR